MSLTWLERKPDDARVAELEAAGYPRLLARLLALRGISAAEVKKFFSPSLADLAAADSLPGVEAAAEAILAAVRAGKLIVVYGDYDCDGLAATAILVRTLRAFGARVEAFIPGRTNEGYGLTDGAVARMLQTFPDVGLVVTVDTGITAAKPIRELQARGIECVVTDHHLPGVELPSCAVVNPKVAAPECLGDICGAGVAFFLSNYLVKRAQEEGLYSGPKMAGPLLVLAGFATVTDVVPLIGQNRILVVEALNRFQTFAPLGLRELFARASRAGATKLTGTDFGFVIGPRLNAAGRVGDVMSALELLLENDRERLRAIAQKVDLLNVERRTIEQTMTAKALQQIRLGASAQVIYIADGHIGVAGIVAANVMRHLEEPCPVCIVEATGHGSARAPAGYNVHEALGAASAALSRFGGHAAAAGFSVKENALEEFRQLFEGACAKQKAAHPGACGTQYVYDAQVDVDDLSLEFVTRMRQMEPFGVGNEEPMFVMRGVQIQEVRTMSAGKHLAMKVCTSSGANSLRAVWWGHGDKAKTLKSNITHDILFTVDISDFNGRAVELYLVSMT